MRSLVFVGVVGGDDSGATGFQLSRPGASTECRCTGPLRGLSLVVVMALETLRRLVHYTDRALFDEGSDRSELVRNGRMDLLAVHPLARAFYKDEYDMPGQPPNIGLHFWMNAPISSIQAGTPSPT